MRRFYIEKLKSASSWGLHKDGTTRQKVKILDTTIRLSDGEVLPLGFTAVSTETSKKIQETSVSALQDLASYSNDEHFLEELCSKLTYFMSDRAANEKLANKMIEEWRDSILDAQQPQNKVKVHHFFCMAHILLGFHTYGVKEVTKTQREIEADGILFGRDVNPAFTRFGREAVCQRTPRMVSEVMGPVGDEKNGVADKWRAHCAARGIKSLITPYKDNRFNAVFTSPSHVLYHKAHICEALSAIESANLKLRSVHMDLQDHKVVTVLCVFAIVGQKLTIPYWEMVTSDTIHYLDFSESVQNMYSSICSWIEDPSTLFDPEEDPVFGQYPPKRDVLFDSSFSCLEENMLQLATRVAKRLLHGLKITCEKQLLDFLQDGIYSNPVTEEEKKSTHSTLTNLSCERNFGSLDSSQQKLRNATLHYHTSVLLLKAQGKNMLQWITASDQRTKLWEEARKMGKTIRQARKENERKVLKEIEDMKEKKASDRDNKRGKQKNASHTKPKAQAREGASDDTDNKRNEDTITNINVGDWICVAYEDTWYIGKVLSLSDKGPNVDFLHHTRYPGTFKRPPYNLFIISSSWHIFHHQLKCQMAECSEYAIMKT